MINLLHIGLHIGTSRNGAKNMLKWMNIDKLTEEQKADVKGHDWSTQAQIRHFN